MGKRILVAVGQRQPARYGSAEQDILDNDPQWLPVLETFLTALKQAGVSGTYWNYTFPRRIGPIMVARCGPNEHWSEPGQSPGSDSPSTQFGTNALELNGRSL